MKKLELNKETLVMLSDVEGVVGGMAAKSHYPISACAANCQSGYGNTSCAVVEVVG